MPAHQAVARHQTGGAGKCRRSTDRAAGIGAERPEAESGRHRHGRPGGRSAGEMLDVPWISGRWPGQIEAGAAMRELMRRELAGDYRTRGPEAAHRLGIPVGNTAQGGIRAPGSQHAFGIVDVLQRDGHPVKRTPAAPGRNLGVRLSRRREGAFGHERHVGIEPRVEGRDPCERRLDQLERRQLPRRDHACGVGQRQVRKINHVSVPRRPGTPFSPRSKAESGQIASHGAPRPLCTSPAALRPTPLRPRERPSGQTHRMPDTRSKLREADSRLGLHSTVQLRTRSPWKSSKSLVFDVMRVRSLTCAIAAICPSTNGGVLPVALRRARSSACQSAASPV